MSVSEVVINALAGIASGGTVAALLRVFTDRPKVRAEATKIITDTASQQVLEMDARLDRALERLDKTEKVADQARKEAAAANLKAERLTGYQRRVNGWWSRHLPWDRGMQAIAETHDPDAVRALPPLEPFPVWIEPEGST